eukprot:GILJ01002427.1.p1 GENE.GILJ01002427.1~~GILJ01002427.1.p1  ORF type:complete len:270 (+),score=25.42 GILJ01002427.1:45-854(+)
MAQAIIGFLGGGQMATAMINGFVKAEICDYARMIVSDPYTPSLDAFRALGVTATSSNVEVASNSEIIIIALKPDVVCHVLDEVVAHIRPSHLVISIAAGVTLSTLQQHLPPSTRVVRVMPNTPCLVGQTAAGFALGSHATGADKETVERIFGAVGISYCVPEKQLDAVTGLSGSGPAYVFMMIEALADGGVRAGLPRPVALGLAAQTVYGSAKMVLDSRKHPGELKDAVASPGGTTIAGIHALEQAGFRAAVMNAVYAASKRSEELGKK